MKSLSDFGWNLRRHTPAWSMRGMITNANKEDLSQASVRSIGVPRGAPSTVIAQRIAAVLDNAGALSFNALVEEVADALYREELGHGAAVLDIGVFGRRLFNPEVVAALYAGNGVYWQITNQRATS